MTAKQTLTKTIVTLVLLLTAGSSHAESPAMSISFHWGATPQTRVDLGFVSHDETGEPAYQRRLALYSSDRRELSVLRMDDDGESRTFCEKTLAGCIAIATVMAVGIFVFVEEFEDESRDKNNQTTFNFNTGSPTSR